MNAAPISYDVPGAAAAVGISKTTVWRLIASGDLVTFKLGARTLIRADVLQAYIDRISSREAA
ncbi:hypothetical protein BBAL3_3457 [Brevundimonas sp. BAL3]|uniref:helix-turn-helix domain-containing protein n=1 Tax=Brevundimonas sp. BAL3 TaxID=391600 RepID=UPI00017EBEB3|nr:helix-turn-helix domain-containing protein [Brevundimonas sp. BAL3]EDX82300.1 hypothetical protein BBAL3_3457 [Brevundimonas sp. BAL3]